MDNNFYQNNNRNNNGNNNGNNGDNNGNGNRPNKNTIIPIVIAIAAAFLFMSLSSYMTSALTTKEITYNQFIALLEQDKVDTVVFDKGKIVLTLKGSENSFIQYKYWTTDLEDRDISLIQELKTKYTDVNFKAQFDSGSQEIIFYVIQLVIMFAVFYFIFGMMMKRSAGGKNGIFGVGKSNAKVYIQKETGVTFKDVAGQDEAKESVVELVDFLHNPGKYAEIGAKLPKGALLVGPPGTGKTLLAKAVAGEAKVPFFSLSGSDFVELYVGVGASRVRDLFAEAKKNAPCIIFIDEIDAVARRRGTGMGGGHDEREQTLNQMLVEMDGFGVNEGIIVMAATNRVDILDPAILRPGRFDRKVLVGRPDVKGRKEILEVHAKNKPIGDDVDLEQIARITSGFTGADLENLLNEASILAAKAGKHFLTQAEINQAMIKVGIGKEKKSRIISEKEKRITAYHESGHAILFHVLPDVGPVHTVSIIPTGAGAAGYTMPLPGKDEMFLTKGKMLQEIMVDLGGRIAEELILDDITTGASQDIKQATATAKSMVTKYGFSDKLGLINYDDESDDVFIGRDLAHSKGYGENTASVIDEEVREIVDTCYKKAKKIIEDHMEQLHASAALLMEKEKIGREEFESLFDSDNNQADSLTNEETV